MNEEVKDLPLFSISPDPNQPRKTFDQEGLQELADSIRENGVILPIIVSPVGNETYQIIAGERRWRASVIAKRPTIPAIIRELEPFTRQMQALLENVQRNDLNPLEEANAYQQLLEQYELSHEEIAQSVGKNRATITNSLRLLKLPGFVQELVSSGKLSIGHAKIILGLNREADQVFLAGKIVQEQLSVRDATKLAESIRNRKFSQPLSTKNNANGKQSQQLKLEIQRLENKLTRHFGTQVQFQLKKEKQGSFSISFQDFAELERILELMNLDD